MINLKEIKENLHKINKLGETDSCEGYTISYRKINNEYLEIYIKYTDDLYFAIKEYKGIITYDVFSVTIEDIKNNSSYEKYISDALKNI